MTHSQTNGFWAKGPGIFLDELAKEEKSRLAPFETELKETEDAGRRDQLKRDIETIRAEFETRRRNARYSLFSHLCVVLFAAVSVLAIAAKPGAPSVSEPVMFNTAAADRILASLQVFPPDNPWNEDISKLAVLKNSKEIIATIGGDKNLAYNLDMAFVLVPGTQKRVPVRILQYPDESDPGPYPIPDNAPIENWPLDGRELLKAQTVKEEGDRHVIVVDPTNLRLYELYQGRKADTGWECASAAVFDLSSNKLRPDGWTSTDAAGLPIFPAIIRYDEVERGMVEHAMRFTVRSTRRAYVYPATHFASRKTDPNLPRMGERFRLRQDFDISGFSKHVQAILKGLKKHGMFVADNGGDWRLSVAPDKRITGLDELRKLKGSDFEVVSTAGPKEGPRGQVTR